MKDAKKDGMKDGMKDARVNVVPAVPAKANAALAADHVSALSNASIES